MMYSLVFCRSDKDFVIVLSDVFTFFNIAYIIFNNKVLSKGIIYLGVIIN